MATSFKFNITDLSYDSLIAAAQSLATSLFPSWVFGCANDLGVFVLELYLHALEKALWLVNRWCGEFNLLTATERRNVENRARTLGYDIQELCAGTGTVVFSYVPGNDGHVVAPNSIRLICDGDDGNPIYFENAVGFSFSPESTSVALTFLEGKTISQNATGTGMKYQSIVLTTDSIINGSVRVSVGGVPWTEVASLVDSAPTDTVFVVERYGDSGAEIIFGNGVMGVVPTNGIAITARTGGGVRGNVAANSNLTVDVSPYPLTLVSNTAFTGGTDLQELDTIRLLAPIHRRSYDRLCTAADVAAFAQSIGGVGRVSVSLSGMNVYVYVVPSDNQAPTTDLLAAVTAAITPLLLMGYSLFVLAPVYKGITVTVTGVAQEGLVAANIQTDIANAILARLNSMAIDESGNYLNSFGGILTLNDLIYVIRNVGELQPGFQLTLPTADTTFNPNQIVSAGASTVNVTVTGGTTLVSFLDRVGS
jgi:hypothetical protein